MHYSQHNKTNVSVMKVWYIGFNLYKQFNSSEEPIVKDFIFEEYESLHKVIISHTYTILQNLNDITFYGAVNKDVNFKEEKNIKEIIPVDNLAFILYDNGAIKKIDTATGDINNIRSFLHIENRDDNQDFVTKIACGLKINIAVSNNNKIFNIPNKLEYEGKKIKEVVAGHEHCLVLDSNGDVYSFGCGIRGQLGHGTLENETNPKLVEALAGIKINKIAAGGWHSCAISITGDLYTWGWNSNGQLAVPSRNSISVFATPQLIDFADPEYSIDDIACGSKHTVICSGTDIFGAGWNKYKQLENTDEENIYEFKLMRNFCHALIKSIICGPWCTVVVTNS